MSFQGFFSPSPTTGGMKRNLCSWPFSFIPTLQAIFHLFQGEIVKVWELGLREGVGEREGVGDDERERET